MMNFNKNILTLIKGNSFAQIFPLLLSPILTRLYSPSEFGVFALFISLSMILGTITAGRYDLTIMLPKKDDSAINLFILGFLITCILSIVLFIFIFLYYDSLTRLFLLKNIDFPFLLLPIMVFLIGLFNLLNYLNTRMQYFKSISNSLILKSVSIVSLQLILSFFKFGSFGLILGQVIGQFVSNMLLLKKVFKEKVLSPNKMDIVKMIALGKRYISFPKFSMVASLFNTTSYHLTSLMISILFNISTLGFYSLTQKVLSAPSSFIGTAISQVFFRELTIDKQKKVNIESKFFNMLKKLFFISIPFLIFLFYIIEDLFAFIFGESWRIAGTFALIVLPFFYIKFIVSIISVVLIVYEKQKVEVIWQGFLITITLIIMLISFYLHMSFENTLILLSLSWSIHYLILLLICINIIKKLDCNNYNCTINH